MRSQTRKRKGKGVSVTVRPGKGRRKPDAEVNRSCAIFWTNQYARVCFLRIMGRYWCQTLEPKCCIKQIAFSAFGQLVHTVQHRPTMLDDVTVVWPGVIKTHQYKVHFLVPLFLHSRGRKSSTLPPVAFGITYQKK